MVDIQSQYFNKVYHHMAMVLVGCPEYVTKNRKGEVLYEMADYSFAVTEPWNCFASCRNMSMEYLRGELDFYMSGSPFLEDIAKYSKFWNKVSDDGRTVNSNYGKLLLYDRNSHNYTQFEYAKSMLVRNPDSKKAVMVIYSPENGRVSNDNPCTMYLQFFIRGGKLQVYVKMRSSDIWFGLPYDVPFFILVQYKMLEELRVYYPELTIGTYYHQAGSLHLYERNRQELLENIRKSDHTALTQDQFSLFLDTIQGRIV